MAGTVLYLAKLGVSSLISSGAGADDKDPDVVVVQVSPPYHIGLPAKDYYGDENVVQNYEDTIAQIIEKMDVHKHFSKTKGHSICQFCSQETAHGVVEFEKKLAAASPDAEDRDDVTVSYCF
jgi:endothelin-converting enzyme